MSTIVSSRVRWVRWFGVVVLAASLALGCTERPRPSAEPPKSQPTGLTPAPEPPPDKSAASQTKRRRRTGANADSPLGTNLDGISDWSANWAFVDAQKQARPFISANPSTWEDKRALKLDERGWPRRLDKNQIVRSLVFWPDQEIWPAGRYVVLYEGEGRLQYDPQGKVIETRPGRQVVELHPARGNFAYIIEKSKGGPEYLRNVRVLMPGGVCEGTFTRWCDREHPCADDKRCVPFEENYDTQIFHPRFLETIEPYSALRFMDWMGTNGSTEVEWKDRPKPADANYRRGVPVEIMVELANRLKQDAWFTMPHAANDEYIRAFATYVRDHLHPELKVFVEYSNEVWNGIFEQASYAVEQGKRLGLGESDWDAQWRWYAHRMVQVHRIWTQVFSGQRERLVRVAGGQAANVGVADLILGYKGVKGNVDAIAIAPYFGGEYGWPEAAAHWQHRSVDELMEDLKKNSIPNAIEMMRQHAALAKRHGVDLVAYEGGQHLVGVGEAANNEKLNRLFDKANRDPRMKELYLRYLRGWREAGGRLFVHFTNVGTPGKYGRWGAMETLLQKRQQAPKYDALLTFIEKNKRWW